jgi:hypothetical protein
MGAEQAKGGNTKTHLALSPRQCLTGTTAADTACEPAPRPALSEPAPVAARQERRWEEGLVLR